MALLPDHCVFLLLACLLWCHEIVLTFLSCLAIDSGDPGDRRLVLKARLQTTLFAALGVIFAVRIAAEGLDAPPRPISSSDTQVNT